MVESFIKYIQFEKRYSPQTVVSYKTDLHQFSKFIAKEFEAKPHEATYPIIRSWIISLSESGMEPRSINRKIACLRSYYKFLMKQQIVTRDPVVKIKILKLKKKLPHFVTEQEMVTVLDNEEEKVRKGVSKHEQLRDKLIVELFYGTGMRLSELINLTDASVNIRDRTVKVLGKRNKERVIPFGTKLVKLMESYREERNRAVEKKEHNYFLVTNDGDKLYPMMVQRMIRRKLGSSHVEKKSPHVLRHTYATHLLNKGAEINAVKDLLGHSSLAATQVYTHNTIEKLKKIFDQAHPKA